MSIAEMQQALQRIGFSNAVDTTITNNKGIDTLHEFKLRSDFEVTNL